MEPRARAGKNVGKMNFGYGELRQLLYGGGDVREPLPETMRILDEIATDFIQSLSFEAARIAHYAGRQKIKYEDFDFALRRNPLFLGKVREMFEMSKEVKDARKMPGIGEGNLAKADVNELAKFGADEEGSGGGGGGGNAADGAESSVAGGGRGRKRGPKSGADGKKAKRVKIEPDTESGGGISANISTKTGTEAGPGVTAGNDGEGGGGGGDGAEEADADFDLDAEALFGGDDVDDPVLEADDAAAGSGGADNGASTGDNAAAEADKEADDLADLDAELDAEMR